jgi:Ca2+-binding RTX toxin-like protein
MPSTSVLGAGGQTITQFFTDGPNQLLQQVAAGISTFNVTNANATVIAGAGNTTVFGGGADGTYFMGPGGIQEFANTGGTGTVFTGVGSPTVFGSFSAAPGSDVVIGGSGALTLATGGSNDTISAGSGPATIFGAFGGTIGNDVIFGGTGILEVVTGGSNDTVFGGTSAGQTVFGGFDSNPANNGNSVIFSGPNAMVIDTAGSSDTIHAGTGNDTLWFGTGSISGSNLVFGGSGDLRAQFIGGAGSVTIIGGTGNSTVFGNAGSNMNFQGSQAGVTMIALGPVGTENGETLNAGASSTNNMLEAVSGTDSVVGGSGNDTLVGGVTEDSSITGAATTMTGGSGDNLFFFQHGNVNGADVITDFAASSGNVFAMSGYDALVGGGSQSAANAALAGATTSNGNTSITLADGTMIAFDNTTVAQLQGHIFST